MRVQQCSRLAPDVRPVRCGAGVACLCCHDACIVACMGVLMHVGAHVLCMRVRTDVRVGWRWWVVMIVVVVSPMGNGRLGWLCLAVGQANESEPILKFKRDTPKQSKLANTFKCIQRSH